MQLATTAGEPPPPSGVSDDAALVRAARLGDRLAFAALHRAWAPTVHGVLLARVRPDQANDLVQETFLRALRRLCDLHDGDAFGPWLLSIARHLAADELQRAGRERIVLRAAANEPAAAAALDSLDDAAAVLKAICSLPDAYRESLTLRLVEGFTGSQIAARLGLTHGSVRVNLHRGMQMLRERLGLEDRS